LIWANLSGLSDQPSRMQTSVIPWFLPGRVVWTTRPELTPKLIGAVAAQRL